MREVTKPGMRRSAARRRYRLAVESLHAAFLQAVAKTRDKSDPGVSTVQRTWTAELSNRQSGRDDLLVKPAGGSNLRGEIARSPDGR